LPFDVSGECRRADGYVADVLALDAAMDEVRQRFGNGSVMRGVLLGRDPGLEMPMLPD
jgi:DNA polymerase-4